MYEVTGWLKWQFCLESKIRHSTIACVCGIPPDLFCLESKIRHSTILRAPIEIK